MTRILALVLAATLTQVAAPALAKNAKHCPPGLAKKSPACVPPGQAKKGVTSKEWQEKRGHEEVTQDDHYDDDDFDTAILKDGDIVRIDGKDYEVIDTRYGPILRREDELYRLPRYDDSEYVRVGDALVRVDRETKNIIDWIKLTHLILS